MQRLKPIRHLIIDMDGVLYLGDKPLPGLEGFFSFLDEHQIRFQLVTNNGTGEHVFNQDAIYRNVHQLTVPGGLMLHEVDLRSHQTKTRDVLGSLGHAECNGNTGIEGEGGNPRTQEAPACKAGAS